MENNGKNSDDESRIAEVTSVISHQLKTPLASIKSSLEVVLSGELGKINSEQREYLRIALDSAEKMIILVKNLLDVSSIDQEKLKLHKEPADMKKIVFSIVEELSHFAQAKNSTINVTVEDNLPLIPLDEVKIREVVNNIIYNAIRYNVGKGVIEISLAKKGGEVVFSCKDNGIGISEEEAGSIFTKYYRNKRAVELATDGSGLGLYISKAIVELSGGRIWYESEKGKGTTFYFSLPIQ